MNIDRAIAAAPAELTAVALALDRDSCIRATAAREDTGNSAAVAVAGSLLARDTAESA